MLPKNCSVLRAIDTETSIYRIHLKHAMLSGQYQHLFKNSGVPRLAMVDYVVQQVVDTSVDRRVRALYNFMRGQYPGNFTN